MTDVSIKIIPMKRCHVRDCEDIVAVSDPWKTLNERIDFFQAICTSKSHTQSYVCVVGAETAGFILFSPDPVFARGGYLRAIGVSPPFRRQGIGRKLLSFAEKMTVRHSCNLFLCVSSFNRRAQSFYSGCGYSRVGKLPGLIAQGTSEYIYWKRLLPLPLKNRRKQRS